MVNIDIGNGVATFTPPAVVAGEVAARLWGLTLSEWFYVTAIVCMVISTVASTVVAILKARNKKGEGDE